MIRVYIATWKDTTHAGEDEGKQWVAEVIEHFPRPVLDIDPEVYNTFGWFKTEGEAIGAAVAWIDENADTYLLIS